MGAARLQVNYVKKFDRDGGERGYFGVGLSFVYKQGINGTCC
ncbi:hypothetical protein P4423_15185 [Bacillus velezensis]|nr:hypothetical protein [Bacillus velezensis]MED3401870.1 hypothetical protein [Bacillus velezensis]